MQGGMFCDGYSFVLNYVRTRKTAGRHVVPSNIIPTLDADEHMHEHWAYAARGQGFLGVLRAECPQQNGPTLRGETRGELCRTLCDI